MTHRHAWRLVREAAHGSRQVRRDLDCRCGATATEVVDTLDTPAEARVGVPVIEENQ